ncbi:MAG: acetyl-CoA carboxylase biotin carboxylase subunit [Deltaproteobacteria bacterium]|nr:acetyl-CoA carboxylase biotin carboxylase subunit [Deltaproteobacteria bacterium]
MFKRILIANRGEIALRVIRACRELGIETVAIYSEADAESPHLEQADQRVCVGGSKSEQSYLNMAAILQAAEQTEAKAVHPGYGFLAENALFAALCHQSKLTFIGPSPRVIRLMGDKATARRTMRAAGLPVVPGSEDVLANSAQGLDLAREMGFPVLLKATAGGGGKGMRICRDEAGFAANWEQASLEAGKAFGNAGLYLEKYVERGRHIEFQFMADAFGHAVHLGERECSVQRSHQKLVEESPATVIDAATRASLGAKVCAGVRAIGYVGAGTMEFLRAPGAELYFMEVNTRLQVEHPVTEMVTGVDLVKEQIRVAANHALSLEQERIALSGHAIECRINAEDPSRGFRPCPGLIESFAPPGEIDGVRVRLDTHVRPGYRIPVFYDSMIGKLIVAGDDREAARAGMIRALEAFRVTGIETTIAFHLRILRDPGFISGDYDTGLVGRLL